MSTKRDEVLKNLNKAEQQGKITPGSKSIIIQGLDDTILPAVMGQELIFGTTYPSLVKFVIDESSSMSDHRSNMVAALNKVRERLVEETNRTGIEVLMSLTTFNDYVVSDPNFEDVMDMPPFTLADYVPKGLTNLYGGIHTGLTETVINGANAYTAGATGYQEFVIIFSDGEPRGSQDKTADEVKSFIAEFISKPHCVLVFLGFGQEHIFVRFAKDLGIPNIRVYDPSNPSWLDDMVLDISSGVSSRSQQAATGQPVSGNFFVT